MWAPSLACLARDGHNVIGVDIDNVKLDLIRRGVSPIVEEGMQELVARVVASGRVQVTDSAAVGVHNSAVSLVCVGTPPRGNGSQDLRALERLASQLGEALREKTTYHVVVIRSTVTPGTVEGTIIPLLEQVSGKRAGTDLACASSRNSCAKARPSVTMTTRHSRWWRQLGQRRGALREVFGHLPCEFRVCATDGRDAHACNAFHALKITFANEMGRICQGLESTLIR
jgi:GDP-mannose 6-dehydrogenase